MLELLEGEADDRRGRAVKKDPKAALKKMHDTFSFPMTVKAVIGRRDEYSSAQVADARTLQRNELEAALRPP